MTASSTTPWIKIALTAAIATGTALWGWFGWLALIWLVCMALDYLSGSIAAIRAHEWSSDRARDGLLHKGGQLLVAAVAVLLDALIGIVLKSTGIRLPWDYSVLFAPLVMVWYSLTELGSIAENAHKLGAPLPEWLRKALKIAKDSVDQTGDDLAGKDDN